MLGEHLSRLSVQYSSLSRHRMGLRKNGTFLKTFCELEELLWISICVILVVFLLSEFLQLELDLG